MQRPTLIFMPGFMGLACDFDKLRSELSGYDSIGLEIPTADSWQDNIHILADAVPQNSVLIGYSMGARLALGTSLLANSQSIGLVLISGNPGLESDSHRKQRWQADQKWAQRIESESKASFLRDWYEQDVFSHTPIAVRSDEIIRKSTYCSEAWPKVMRVNSIAKQPNYWPEIENLNIPVLAVAGEADEKYAKIAVRCIKRSQSPLSRVKIFTECGHVVHREQPGKLTDSIREYLSCLR
ncbi:MAG: alpha/beta fold hydrolase [Mariniblastus sp.]|nr:alpha/beta fold hydrolase [Mariniblastus sp.]